MYVVPIQQTFLPLSSNPFPYLPGYLLSNTGHILAFNPPVHQWPAQTRDLSPSQPYRKCEAWEQSEPTNTISTSNAGEKPTLQLLLPLLRTHPRPETSLPRSPCPRRSTCIPRTSRRCARSCLRTRMAGQVYRSLRPWTRRGRRTRTSIWRWARTIPLSTRTRT